MNYNPAFSILKGNRVSFSYTPSEKELFFVGYYTNYPTPSIYYSKDWHKINNTCFIFHKNEIISRKEWNRHHKRKYRAFTESFK